MDAVAKVSVLLTRPVTVMMVGVELIAHQNI
jgi:hypothetical protein